MDTAAKQYLDNEKVRKTINTNAFNEAVARTMGTMKFYGPHGKTIHNPEKYEESHKIIRAQCAQPNFFAPTLDTGPAQVLTVQGQEATNSTVSAEYRRQLREELAAGSLKELEIEIIAYNFDAPNRNPYTFRPQHLGTFAESFGNAPFLQDHYESVDKRYGTILEGKLTDGNSFYQRILITTAKGLQDFVEGKIDRFSIGWFYEGVTCTICNSEFWSGDCFHWPGRTYEYKDEQGNTQRAICKMLWEHPTGRENSAVAVPAVTGTAVLQAITELKTALTENHEPKETQAMTTPTAETTIDEPAQTQNDSSSGIETPTPTPAPPQQQPPAAQPPAVNAEWQDYFNQQALQMALTNSGLGDAGKDVVKAILGIATNFTPKDVENAIALQKASEAEIAGKNLIQGNTPINAGQMTTGMDRWTQAMYWQFGVTDDEDKEIELPEPGLRKLDELYVAATGDRETRGYYGGGQDWSPTLANANTNTFPNVVLNALNKIIDTHWTANMAYRWFEMITDVLPHDGTTHDIQLIYIDGVTGLPIVGEGAPYTEVTVGDSKETMEFFKRGHFIGITIEMIKKSNIQQIREMPREMVAACLRTRSEQIAQLFTQNSGAGPTLKDDATALFHANHANLITAALSGSGWKTASDMMYKQIKPGTGKRIAIEPEWCLIPRDLKEKAVVSFNYGSGNANIGRPNAAGTAQESNPWGNGSMFPRPKPLVVPEWTDTNNWAAMANPMHAAPIKMAYVNQMGGMRHPRPEIFQARDANSGMMFTNDTLAIKIRDWFAVGVGHWIGILKANVAGA